MDFKVLGRSRDRLNLGRTVVALSGCGPGPGVGGRGSMAGASQAGIEQSPVRPAGAGVLPGTPSHTRGAATPPRWVAVTPVLPLREQCSGQRPVRW